ncbi:MAG: hypothetical protein ACN4EP_00385 [Sediminibacterium sp.]|nr:hypothetical protein [uncultured Sediminibacterium sp.]
MRFGLIIVFLIVPYAILCQVETQRSDSVTIINPITTQSNAGQAKVPLPNQKPELFNSGFIDFQNSGQMNASSRVFRVFIGEPGKFTLPISIYSGVTGNTSALRGSEPLMLGLINPLSGAFNISTDNMIRLGNNKSITGFSAILQVGEKLLIGQQATTLKSFNFFSTYTNFGIHFQTGAWEKNKEKNMGVFWVLARYHLVQIANSFQRLSGYPPDEISFRGYSIGVGIEINNVLNIKSYYYRYIEPGVSTFEVPIYQLTFNYSMRTL